MEIIGESIINSIFFIILLWLFVFIPQNIKRFPSISDFFLLFIFNNNILLFGLL
ncbi:hypothetical protein AYWB_124 [Aster yellows witches'-broom phytoplasma AYWB]|uniref:Uncharacterized protein n=1 Tax=Aster yellows witches'-broom phytoplasma (strain AYWB) TaxID=322098 RepID=Q2NK02_AYWBP|nr:hypothetical protein AYWB_124 [Aster yellows witches'-broom phytoplasma AYWB]